MSFSNHEQHSSLRSNELACPSARAVLGETGTKGLSVLLRVRCLPMAFPAAIRLERRRRHVPSQKAAPKKTTEFHAHPKDLHMARMSHQQLGQDQWLRCPSWVNRVGLTAYRRLPVYPEQRTSSDHPGMSQTCHEQTSRRILLGDSGSSLHLKLQRRRLHLGRQRSHTKIPRVPIPTLQAPGSANQSHS